MVDIQRAPRCGHAWIVGIDTTLHDGLRDLLPVRVRDIWDGFCPLCGEPIAEWSSAYVAGVLDDQ